MDIGGYFLCREMNFGMQGYQGRGLTGYERVQGRLRRHVGRFDLAAHLSDRRPLRRARAYCETSEGPDADGTLIRLRLTTGDARAESDALPHLLSR